MVCRAVAVPGSSSGGDVGVGGDVSRPAQFRSRGVSLAMATTTAATAAEAAAVDPSEVVAMAVQQPYDDEGGEEATAAAAMPDAVSPTAHLDGLSMEELKATLSEKKKGWVNLDRYKDSAALIAAIHAIEQKEAAQAAFRQDVAAAAHWYAEQVALRKARHRPTRSSRLHHDGDAPAEDSANGGEARHELLVHYNEANGYAAKYAELVKELQEAPSVSLPNLEDIHLVGLPYPMSPNRVLASKALQGAFFATLGLALLGDQLTFLPAAALATLRARRGLIISTGFMLNILSRAALQNSAFEVYLDGKLIYSAMNAGGRVPTAEMVSNLILERTLLKDFYATTADVPL